MTDPDLNPMDPDQPETGPELGNDEQKHADFLRCYSQSYHRIFGYILTMLPNTEDAEEVLQETSIVLWKKFDTFQPGTDFVRWACAVAKRMTLKYLRERKKNPPLLSEHMLQRIVTVRLEKSDMLEQRRMALKGCLKKLAEHDRQLVQQRYAEKINSRQLARQIGRPENTVYKALSRIRQQLMKCVDRVLCVEDRA